MEKANNSVESLETRRKRDNYVLDTCVIYLCLLQMNLITRMLKIAVKYIRSQLGMIYLAMIKQSYFQLYVKDVGFSKKKSVHKTN